MYLQCQFLYLHLYITFIIHIKTLDKMSFYKEIIRQLGGNKFLVMTGTKNLVFSENDSWLRMELTRNKLGAKWLKITLNGLDLYDIQFIYNKKTKDKKLAALGINVSENTPVVLKEYKNVYSDMLVKIFETETGLYTSL